MAQIAEKEKFKFSCREIFNCAKSMARGSAVPAALRVVPVAAVSLGVKDVPPFPLGISASAQHDLTTADPGFATAGVTRICGRLGNRPQKLDERIDPWIMGGSRIQLLIVFRSLKIN